MGTINAWWSEQVWYDPNCRLNIYWDANVGNPQTWDYRRQEWVNGALTKDTTPKNIPDNIPIPGQASWRYPAATTFQFLVQVGAWSYANGVWNLSSERDRAGWGPGAYPYPPTPPPANLISTSATKVARAPETWDLYINSDGNVTQIFVYDPVNGEPYYAGGGASCSYRYTMPAGVRTATARLRYFNQGPYGAQGEIRDAFITLNSNNLVPAAPTGVSSAPPRIHGVPIVVSWSHSDPEGDAQTKYQLRYQKTAGPGATFGWTEGSVVTTAAGTGALPALGAGVYDVQVRTWDWEDNPGPWSASTTFEVYGGFLREGGLWVPSKQQIKVNGSWVPTVKVEY